MSGGGETGAPATPDLSAILGKLTENPELLSSIASGLRASMPTEPAADKPTVEASALPSLDPEMLTRLLPVVSALGGGGGKRPDSPRCTLLSALKPFLSPERCRAVDYMIKMDGLGGLLQNFK